MTARDGAPPDAAPRPGGLGREGWDPVDEAGFIGLVGPFWRHGTERDRFSFQADARHANFVGIVQGGMLMTFADRVLGTLAWEAAGNRPVVTVSFDMQFSHAARLGAFVEMTGEVVRATGSLVFMRGLLNEGTRTLGACGGAWKILTGRSRRQGPGVAQSG